MKLVIKIEVLTWHKKLFQKLLLCCLDCCIPSPLSGQRILKNKPPWRSPTKLKSQRHQPVTVQAVPHRSGARWWEWRWPGGRCFPPPPLPWSLWGHDQGQLDEERWERSYKVRCVFIPCTHLLLGKSFAHTEAQYFLFRCICVCVRACVRVSVNVIYIYWLLFVLFFLRNLYSKKHEKEIS